ncbi:hypothetical protein FOQG_15673 [Fusarium oxysporum f. sp. raphani 54005]|uniref:Uncharacterized protein n=4 Tax=Fusarium oxysporum TaxID=5507 RepID=X0BMR5_FUSOX|nr:hypothetical protein FOVG_12506 [Fusarium oxysporum f. sp. pisi HDV247]EXK79749.1 hypothetical protein FOQG_15673 [Fusarium oxysporum f. sp. raphani 54005]EXL73312.1 hypothetical protein FOPG_11370 [Fusarium oxysporum f. sp. conglutinans race 2 54008]EXM22854.1 hypothetical protein FOTG_09600 [Fusarium oxysporum f. sp. vasinfectum 25433]
MVDILLHGENGRSRARTGPSARCEQVRRRAAFFTRYTRIRNGSIFRSKCSDTADTNMRDQVPDHGICWSLTTGVRPRNNAVRAMAVFRYTAVLEGEGTFIYLI